MVATLTFSSQSLESLACRRQEQLAVDLMTEMSCDVKCFFVKILRYDVTAVELRKISLEPVSMGC